MNVTFNGKSAELKPLNITFQNIVDQTLPKYCEGLAKDRLEPYKAVLSQSKANAKALKILKEGGDSEEIKKIKTEYDLEVYNTKYEIYLAEMAFLLVCVDGERLSETGTAEEKKANKRLVADDAELLLKVIEFLSEYKEKLTEAEKKQEPLPPQ